MKEERGTATYVMPRAPTRKRRECEGALAACLQGVVGRLY